MTYPLVRARVASGFFTSATHNVPLPHSEPGDLLLIRIASDSGDSVTVPGVWDTLKNGLIPTNAFTDVVICKASAGTDYGEPTTVLIEVDPGEPITFIAESYQDWDGVTLPEISNGVAGSATFPDSESLTASWGADDNLFVTWFGMDWANRDVLGYPDDYLDERLEVHHPLAVAGGHQALYSASRNLAAATDDPGPFNAVDDQWSAYTLVIRGTPTVLTLEVDSITAPIESGSTATIAGTEFGTLVSATQSGAAVPFSNATANSVDVDTLDIEAAGWVYGPKLFTITNDLAESDTIGADVIPLAGNKFVNVLNPLIDTNERLIALPDFVDADQVRYQDVLYLNGIATPHTVTVNPDLSVTIGDDGNGNPPDNDVYTFGARAYGVGLGWGLEATITLIVSLTETLIVNDITQAQALTGLTLVSDQFLAVNDVAQTQALDSIALTGPTSSDLFVNDITQAQALTVATLSSNQFLTVNDIVQAQALTVATLQRKGILSVSDITQAQFLTSPVLELEGALTVFDIMQAQALTVATLSSSQGLAVNDLTQAQALTEVILSDEKELTVNDIVQAQALDDILLNDSTALNVNDIRQAQVFSEISLTSHLVLTVNDLTQSQRLDVISWPGILLGELAGEVVFYLPIDCDIAVDTAIDLNIRVN